MSCGSGRFSFFFFFLFFSSAVIALFLFAILAQSEIGPVSRLPANLAVLLCDDVRVVDVLVGVLERAVLLLERFFRNLPLDSDPFLCVNIRHCYNLVPFPRACDQVYHLFDLFVVDVVKDVRRVWK